LRDYDGAMASFGRRFGETDYAEALCNRATASLELKRFDEAMGGFDRALMLSPGWRRLGRRGTRCISPKRNSRSDRVLWNALLLEPKSHRAHRCWGNVLPPWPGR